MNEIAARALALVGTRFRLHGRDPATGLDCIGLVSASTGVPARTGYSLRGGDPREVETALRAAGFFRVAAAMPGDVVLSRPGPGQLHMGVSSATGVVHADATLRRVVERPGAPEGEILGIWRRLS